MSRDEDPLNLLSDSDSEVFKDDPEAQKAADYKSFVKREHVQAWIKDTSDRLHVRSFNINEIFGKFQRGWDGQLISRPRRYKNTNIYHDDANNVVNEKGYLMDPETGDLRSKYTFETVFKAHELIGATKSEIPLPYRMENHNFNPHECFGYFQYDQHGKHE